MPFLISSVKYTDKVYIGSIAAKLLVTLLAISIPTCSYAGAWTQNKGNGQIITNLSYYSSGKYFDNSGKKRSTSNYSKYEVNPYMEYGVRDWLTIGANLFAQRSSQYNTGLGRQQTNWGIGDSELFFRTRLWNDKGLVISAEPMLKLPSIDSRTEQPQIGNPNYDTGLTLSGGYSFKALELDHFINIDAGYRHRFGAPKDQLKFAATAGISVTKRTKILTQLFRTSRITDTGNTVFTQSSGDDYDLNKLQVSAVYQMDDKLSFQLGAYNNISGRNTGSGDGALLAVSKEF